MLCDNLEEWELGRRFRGRGPRYNYGCFMLLCGRNQYNLAKQLSSNKNKYIFLKCVTVKLKEDGFGM